MTHYTPPPQYPPPLPPRNPAPPYGGYGQIPFAHPHLSRRPAVVTWFYVYCVGMALLYAGLAAFIGWLMSEGGHLTEPADEFVFNLMLIVCVPLMVVFVVGPLLPRRPWAWIYDLILICIGMSGITAVACVPMLIFWLKPEAKAWFGRQA